MTHLIRFGRLSIIGLLLCGDAISTERIIHSFGPGSDGDPAWQRRYNAQLGHFRLDAEGWLIDYRPEKRSPAEKSTTPYMKSGGYRSEFRVAGDFRVSVDYEVQRIGIPRKGPGAGIMLRLSFDDQRHSVLLGHTRNRKGNWMIHGRFHSKNGEHQPFAFETVERLNQLTIVREGSRYSFLQRGGSGRPEEVFTYLPPAEIEGFGQIEVFVTSGRSSVPIGLRVHSIAAEADQLLAVEHQADAPSRAWVYLALLFGMAAVGAWFRLRWTQSR